MLLGIRKLKSNAIFKRQRCVGIPADQRRTLGDGVGWDDGAPAMDVVENDTHVVIIEW